MNSEVRDVLGYGPFEPKPCVTFSVFPTVSREILVQTNQWGFCSVL